MTWDAEADARLDAELREAGFEPCPFEPGCITWIKPDDALGLETHREEWHRPRHRADAVACPVCGAEPGQPCLGAEDTHWAHLGRDDVWLEAGCP